MWWDISIDSRYPVCTRECNGGSVASFPLFVRQVVLHRTGTYHESWNLKTPFRRVPLFRVEFLRA